MIPIRYVEPVFRPPSEAESLILPVTDGWEARCSLPDDDGYARFLANLRAGGRGKIRLEVSIPRGDRVAVSFSGSYAAIIRTASESVPSPPPTSPAG